MLDPIALKFGPLKIRWYGVAYILGFLFCLWMVKRENEKKAVFKTKDQLYDLAFWVFLLGLIGGGRLGYVLFYNLPYFIGHPLSIFAIWQGGMSFHGGLIGMVIVGYLYCKKHGIDTLKVADLVVVAAPIALALGRFGNFINRELVGRVIENPKWLWLGIDFGDGMTRYPSQLFAVGKDLLIFLILFLLSRKERPRGVLFGAFLTLYGFLRFLVEFYREPDPQIGFILNYLTLGQTLSVMMLFAGLIFLIKKK